jgi:maleylpyruvate isomerase
VRAAADLDTVVAPRIMVEDVMTTTPDIAAFDLALDEMARATDRLLATVDGFSDADVRAPSGLPDWTRAHVLTHLARNADAMARLAHWARTGEERAMYPGGPPARNAAIEEGAGRHIGDLRLDLSESAERLLAGFAGFDAKGLGRDIEGSRGARWIGWELPLIRMREVEIHHVDLAAGYTSADWTPAFAVHLLDLVSSQFLARDDCPVSTLQDTEGRSWQAGTSGPALSGPATELAAWLIGRSDGSALTPNPPGAIPAAPRWI